MTVPVVEKDGIYNAGMYIINWTEHYDRRGQHVTHVHRDIAQAHIDSNGDISWMVTGQEWNGVDHKFNNVHVLAYIDIINLRITEIKE